MKTIRDLAYDNMKQPSLDAKKVRIRENTALFNMILVHLHANREMDNFNCPFETCSKTLSIYKRQAEKLHLLGIKSILKYDTAIINILCEKISELATAYRPKSWSVASSNLDLLLVLSRVGQIKNTLSKITLDEQNKMTFSAKPLNLTQIIYLISSVINLYKSVKKDEESLHSFLLKNTDHEFIYHMENQNLSLDVDLHTKKEGEINRKFIYGLKALVISVFKVQLSHYKGFDLDIEMIDLKDPYWIERVLSTALDL